MVAGVVVVLHRAGGGGEWSGCYAVVVVLTGFENLQKDVRLNILMGRVLGGARNGAEYTPRRYGLPMPRGDAQRMGLTPTFPPPSITMSSAQIDPGDGYPQRSRSAVPRPWRGEIPSSARCSDRATQVAPISRGGGCAHAVSIADMMPSPCPMLAWHVAGCGARRRHSYGRSGRRPLEASGWNHGWGSPALFPAGSAAMPFAEGEGLWGTVWTLWRGGGGMGWGVGGRVGGGGDSRAKVTAINGRRR